MSKENILFSVVGVLLGFIVGFAFANTVNQRGRVEAVSVHAVVRRNICGERG